MNQKPIIKGWFMEKLLQLDQAHKQYRTCITQKFGLKKEKTYDSKKYLDQVMTVNS